MKQQYLVLIIEPNQIYALRVGTGRSGLQVLGRFELEFQQGELVNGQICNFTALTDLMGAFLHLHRLDHLPVVLVFGDQLIMHKLGLTSQVSWRQEAEGCLQQVFDLGDSYYLAQVQAAQVLQYDLFLSSLKLYLEIVTGYSAALLTYLRANQIKFNSSNLDLNNFQRGLLSSNPEFDRDCVAMGAICQGAK